MKKVFSIILVTVAILISSETSAMCDPPTNALAKASISGKVVDIKTGESLVGVAVKIEGTDFKAYTDLDGNFTINSIDPGTYNLVLSLISYKNSLVENLNINTSKKEIVAVKLDAIR